MRRIALHSQPEQIRDGVEESLSISLYTKIDLRSAVDARAHRREEVSDPSSLFLADLEAQTSMQI